MTTKYNQQTVLLPDVFSKSVVAVFDSEGQSSDGGVVLLSTLDQSIGLTESLVGYLKDSRNSERVLHPYADLFHQRVLGIALGYSDCNDAERIGSDPCLKMACGRAPLDDSENLGSQPMLSRFENSQDARTTALMLRELEIQVITRLAKRHRKAKRITIDLDPSCDPTHGHQQFSLFHGFYDTSCFLPQFGFLSIDDQPEQYLFHARLRPGNARCYRGAIPLLRRTVGLLRRKFPKARIRVRLDGGFSNPDLLNVLDELRVEYVVGMKSNSVLDKLAEPLLEKARAESERSGESEQYFSEDSYQAGSWSEPRRVIIKAEVVQHPGRDPKDNARFVITNLKNVPFNVYNIYKARGDAENRIKEMKHLDSDRTSCSRFLANQLRLLMTAAAFVLYQELRWRLRRTEVGRAQVSRLQIMLMKIATRVVESVRRVVLHFPIEAPWRNLWKKAASAVGAVLT